MSFKCHTFRNDFINKRPNVDSKKLPEQFKMPLPYIIHLTKGKYPQSGQGPLHFSTMSYISHISQVYADKPKQ